MLERLINNTYMYINKHMDNNFIPRPCADATPLESVCLAGSSL